MRVTFRSRYCPINRRSHMSGGVRRGQHHFAALFGQRECNSRCDGRFADATFTHGHDDPVAGLRNFFYQAGKP